MLTVCRAASEAAPGAGDRRPGARARDVFTTAAAGRPRGAGAYAGAAAGAARGRRRRRRRAGHLRDPRRRRDRADRPPADAGAQPARPRTRSRSRTRRRPAARRRRPDGRRAGVRGDVPARRRPTTAIPALRSRAGRARRLARRRRAARGSGTSTSTSTTSAPPSRPGIEAGRPHRVRVTHFAEQIAEAAETRAPSSAPGARSSPWPPGRACRRSSRRPARSWCPAAPGAARRPARSSRRSPAAVPARSWSCPTTRTRCGWPRSRPAPRRPTTASGSR